MTEERAPARLFDPVDRGDVGMIERGEDPRLALEAGDTVRVGRERVGQHLDGDVSSEPGVGRLVDVAHAPRPEVARDLVMSEPGANHPWQLYSQQS
jgi:hypothetical protein